MKINIRAMSIALALTFFLITVLTIQTELSADFKTSLASLTGHHWTSKGVVSLTFFTLATLVLSAVLPEQRDVKKPSLLVALATVVFGAIMLLFFVSLFIGE